MAMGFFWWECEFLLSVPVKVELGIPAIVLVVVERKIPAIVVVAAGNEDPAIVPAVAEEVGAVVRNVLLYDTEVAVLEVGLHSVGLPVEEEPLQA